jgi:uncharacterized protein GlcG (DUF336 family)
MMRLPPLPRICRRLAPTDIEVFLAMFQRTTRPKPVQPRQKKLACERLEPRHLLAVDVDAGLLAALDELEFYPAEPVQPEYSATTDPQTEAELEALTSSEPPPARHNPVNPHDVDLSGALSPIDALLAINHVLYGDPSLAAPDEDSAPGVFATDVNNDGSITVADAAAVIAAIDRLLAPQEAEGESSRALAALPVAAPLPPPVPPGDAALPFITATEVETLLARAAGATSTEDAIIAIVDRGGRILGVRTEAGVLANIPDLPTLAFAIDGAVAKARTAAFFANNQAPLTSRTVRSLSQSTITQREVQSNPTVPDPLDPGQNPFVDANAISRTFGPGLVAPIGVGGHFPPDVKHTPPVDLFRIELQSRDGLVHPGVDGIKGTADDILLDNRFNVPTAFLPQGDIPAPESYGVQSGLVLHAQGRGLATMPGGIPLYKAVPDPVLNTPFTLVGGIGVFFPGIDGYATHEQGFIPGGRQTSTQRLNANKALEAEFIAIAAPGGVTGVRPVGAIGGLAPPAGYVLPFGRIDLVGITLEVFGPNPTKNNRQPGINTVMQRGRALGQGSITTGDNQIVESDGGTALDGLPVVAGWIVAPHDSPLAGPNKITAADVERIVMNSINEAHRTRSAIRLDVSKSPPTAGPRAKMVIAVADTAGNVLGLFRMHDATVFSIDVAVAKARNTAYYADAAALQDSDKVDDDLLVARGATTVARLNQLKHKNNAGAIGTPDLFNNNKSSRRYTPLTGLAFTNRTFRFLAEPRYPTGAENTLPPVFSILTDPGINRKTAENFNQAFPTPASQFTSVVGFDAFHASRNFRDPGDVGIAAPGFNPDPLANQNGIVFFPGSTPLYKSQILVGGFGISGDGVDQDDVVTFAGQQGFAPPQHLRADMVFYRGVRLPFQKFNRNPRG